MLPGDSAVQQEAQPVVTKITEPVSDAQDFLDQQVDRFGGAVADSAAAEVGQELISPRGEGAGQPPEFGNLRRYTSRSSRRGGRGPGHDRGRRKSAAALWT